MIVDDFGEQQVGKPNDESILRIRKNSTQRLESVVHASLEAHGVGHPQDPPPALSTRHQKHGRQGPLASSLSDEVEV